jgi:hypothetical protein
MIDYNNHTPPVLHRLVSAIVRGGAVSVEVFLHRRFGLRYLSTFGPLAAGMMLIYAAFVPVQEARPFFVYVVSFGVCWLLLTIETWLRFWRGDNEHSGYGGFPRLLRRSLAFKEYRVKQLAEPMLVGIAGYCALELNRPLAIYVIFAAGCLFLSNAVQRRNETREAMMLHDATLEQQHRVNRFREIHGVRN